ncbi:septum site-determining protein MinC [Xenorhabdus nematophila]|uniref:Probable septum site-determining protein MinC n=1 Tax=Xenorhabdus nematophila (strain ATCC 19061 / DSM 3370 / CCUG 14189 / LMG 1036 / NCIMB 9965 / AN6) TaxID=406817 RepID=D3VFD7_XENNA|nr:septum site-determining protein MinC [Xenorhabdus nematophila]CEE93258.1 cell division inhibitor, inhibits FtsZ ring formation [Xenorhabdus nematophila str. Anatoliense]CBJ90251.1 cell division inhibitor, inhibits FtsZ ring formation [Xenorhabdus nematophila ATCC 19061]CCW32252.1 putative septum site-determining protein MinC [Xenorhabdus nematophila F1]CEE96056.1 cell division inhibitor, inhibits FtsZ ring formation [Xenorhabdus nematophila str. Anatoliense]CEK23114.1 cell division inhibito
MSQSPIELKGSNFTLSVVHLYDDQPEVIHRAIQEKMEQAPAFLKNAPVVINISALPVGADLIALHRVIESVGLRVVGISGCQDEEQRKIVLKYELPLLKEGKSKKTLQEDKPAEPIFKKTRIINTPVRSGQRIYAPNSDLIVTNNVSAGAELIADGNIHIYGVLRGRVLAGASGDQESQIFCTHLNAELTSIAGQYWLSEKVPENFVGKAAKLRLVNNELTIETLV